MSSAERPEPAADGPATAATGASPTPSMYVTQYPTVADVLQLGPVKQGGPRVVAGAAGLDRVVRWVHVTELVDVGTILRGGELVLSTGIAWPEDRDRLADFVADLAKLGAAGLVLELGRRYTDSSLPKALLAAAEKHSLPVITLALDTRFVTITEAVHGLIIDAQLAELRASDEVHQTFTELAVEGASPDEVVQQIGRMSGCPVVLENLAHQVLTYSQAGADPAVLLDGWEGRSRSVRPTTGRTVYDERSGWLTTVVGARGHDWGRLVLICNDPAPVPRLSMLLERAAATLALNRLVERDRDSLERQTHRTLLTAILSHGQPASEVALRARALGVTLDGRRLVGVVLRLRTAAHPTALETQARLRELTDQAAAAIRDRRLSALIGTLDEHSVGLLLALGPQDREDAALDGFAERVRRLVERPTSPSSADGYVIAVGTSVGAVRDARRSLLEAVQVADAAVRQPAVQAPYHRLVDVRLRGLLHLLRDDARLQTFVERELGPLLAYDAERGTDLVRMLTVYVDSGRNKSAAADAAHLSRPSFYERLHRIERILSVDLDSVESCLALHVALLALEAIRP
ncbi:transcriptional regulator, CdaR [Catenulispora acidiphila DSM 44928]|uniref:Transcriptional regulator, CdaR n=2 Tax=Catenulispora TaxID=414878 RepID=C7Q5F6_CATAD|nr:PucR family transcriptional regulator ligand-binding domain-containing protein [Catenulispora acidiphila]ACU75925.1 transcriptional regulator, CdaR [Catenulispora acidiphila DSM 44928]